MIENALSVDGESWRQTGELQKLVCFLSKIRNKAECIFLKSKEEIKNFGLSMHLSNDCENRYLNCEYLNPQKIILTPMKYKPEGLEVNL